MRSLVSAQRVMEVQLAHGMGSSPLENQTPAKTLSGITGCMSQDGMTVPIQPHCSSCSVDFRLTCIGLLNSQKRTDLQTVKTSLWCTVIQTGETLAATMYSRGMSTKMHLQGHGRTIQTLITWKTSSMKWAVCTTLISAASLYLAIPEGALSIIAAFERPDLFAGYCAQAGFVGANDYDDRLFELASTAEHRVPGVLVHGEADPDVTVQESDRVAGILSGAGWTNNEDWLYIKIPNATHEWQTQYNQQVWDFLYRRPNPLVQP